MLVRRSLTCVLLVAAAACGATAGAPAPADQGAGADDCVPNSDLLVQPRAGEDRRFEDVEEYITGYRLEDFPEGQAPPNADPNWGGVWGDFADGMVVAVLDCSVVDVTEVALLAGPTGTLRIIEVPYTFVEVNDFRDSLQRQLAAAGVEHEVVIDSTLTGRHIEVRVRDVAALPDGFGRDLPGDVYSTVETDDLSEEN